MSKYRSEIEVRNQIISDLWSRLNQSKRTGVMRKESLVSYVPIKPWGSYQKGQWGYADLVIFERGKENPLFIMEFKSTTTRIHKGYGKKQLENYIIAEKALFGILANSTDITQWIFYRRSGQKIERISQIEFETIIF